MEKRATMHEVAEAAGVSQATVSLVLNGVRHARISKATRRRVFEAAEQLGYRRGKAHPVPQDRKHVIGLFIDEVSTTPFAAPFIEGARDEAALQDVTVAVFCTGNNTALEQAALDMLVSQQAIGAIYATLMTREVTVPASFSALPLVLLNCYERKLRYPSVVPGDIVGGYTATAALLKQGHRRIAHLAGDHTFEAAADRERGFREAMQKWGAWIDEALVVPGGWTIRAGRDSALKLLSAPEPPTAIFCYNDRMAISCYQAAEVLGIDIPAQLSIVGFDNDELAESMMPPLTSMILPHDEMARWAVGRVLESIEGTDADEDLQKLKIECELVARESVAGPNL